MNEKQKKVKTMRNHQVRDCKTSFLLVTGAYLLSYHVFLKLFSMGLRMQLTAMNVPGKKPNG